jgi:hypothetical protein
MLLYKMPMDLYQQIMHELHHQAPLEEQDKIKVQQEQLLGARDSRGRSLVSVEGEGMESNAHVKMPTFE